MPETLYAIVALVLLGGVVWYFFFRSRPSLPAPDADNDPSRHDLEKAPSAADKPVADKPVADKPAADKPVADKPVADKPVADKPAADKPAADKPAADKPAADKPAADKPAADKPAADKPIADKPIADKPAADKPAAAPVSAEPEASAPATAQSVVEARTLTLPKVEGDLSALKRGLAQTRGGWMQRLRSVFGGKKEIDAALLETIEETLLTGDVGMATTRKLVDGLQRRLERRELSDDERVWQSLRDESRAILDLAVQPFGSVVEKPPLVIMLVGVNGAGKTTTIAKLAGRYKESGRRVLLAAGDTFRAAAVQQLEMWGKRVGVDVHKGKDNARPQTVMFETVQRGVNEGYDVVLADTAGRLQTKIPLMEELRKIREAAGKACPGAPHEVLLVLDATTGQNAISQAREFREALELTGVVLTKLDGTARGGVILAVADEFKLPVRFVGVGEKADDLRDFNANDFVEALFARPEDDQN